MMHASRRTFMGQSALVAGCALASASTPALAKRAPAKVMRYKYARAGGPPNLWAGLKIIDTSTGDRITDYITEANAEEGWYRSYVLDDDGKTIFDPREDGGLTKLHQANLEITIDEDLFPGRIEDGRYCMQDLAAGVVYEEDMSDVEREWVGKGCPQCPACQGLIDDHGAPCHRCKAAGRRTAREGG